MAAPSEPAAAPARPGGRAATGTLGVTGLAAAVLAVATAGHAYTGTTTPPTSWLGLLAPSGYRPGDSPWFGVLLWLALAGLTGCWLAALRLQARGRLDRRRVWGLAAAWAAPLALGPPLVSKDIWAYAAQGTMTELGLDVYRRGPQALATLPGHDAARALAAVDPRWRGSPSPYGPVTTLLERLGGALGGGDPVATAVLLRVVAVLSVIGLGLAVAALVPDRHRDRALALVLLNPLLLVHGLADAHVEALMGALLVAGLAAAGRGRWGAAVALVAVAGLVKAPALLALPAVLAAHACTVQGRARAVALGRDLVVAAAALLLPSLLVPHGWGWLRNVRTPGGGDPTFSPIGNLAELAGPASGVVVATGALAAAVVLLWLAAGLTTRPLPATVGWALLAVAFLAPVTYPWYALWGMSCLLPVAGARARTVLVALSVVLTFSSVPGAPGPLTAAFTGVAALAAVVVVARRLRARPGVSDRRSVPAAR